MLQVCCSTLTATITATVSITVGSLAAAAATSHANGQLQTILQKSCISILPARLSGRLQQVWQHQVLKAWQVDASAVAACDAYTCEVTRLLSVQLNKAGGKAGEV
jgi:hypothetical protein